MVLILLAAFLFILCSCDLSGHDLQFGTNVLGHYYLTSLVLPALKAAAKSLPVEDRGDVRVVNVASSGVYAYPTNDLLWNTLKDGPPRRKKIAADPMFFYVQVCGRFCWEDVLRH